MSFFSWFMGNESEHGTNKSPENRFAVHAFCFSEMRQGAREESVSPVWHRLSIDNRFFGVSQMKPRGKIRNFHNFFLLILS